MPSIVPALVELLTTDMELGVRIAVARAIGVSGFDAATEGRLFEKLKESELRNAAALALILGGTPDTAARTVAMYADFGRDAHDGLRDHHYHAWGH